MTHSKTESTSVLNVLTYRSALIYFKTKEGMHNALTLIEPSRMQALNYNRVSMQGNLVNANSQVDNCKLKLIFV